MIARAHCSRPQGQSGFGFGLLSRRMEAPDLDPARGETDNRTPGFAVTARSPPDAASRARRACACALLEKHERTKNDKSPDILYVRHAVSLNSGSPSVLSSVPVQYTHRLLLDQTKTRVKKKRI